jgi:hypothetical protein
VSLTIRIDSEVAAALSKRRHDSDHSWNDVVARVIERQELEDQLTHGGLTTPQMARLHQLRVLDRAGA